MNLDTRNRVHLEWMFENQPELMRELHRQNKLADHLERKNQRALELVDKLKSEHGMSEDEAFDVATSTILAPPDGPAMTDNPPDPVPWQEQEQMMNALEASPT